MHRHRLHLLCGLAVVAATAAVVFTGAEPASIGLLAAALLCPTAMVIAMRLLLGPTDPPPNRTASTEDPQ